ncbi:MAG: phenylalanine--tRNA ligase subunit beta [Ignavibacteriales bacterium]|nr:phenylalanine--tRNA ligase subunit beta [Ignavibacteriales bacterium]
MKISLNWLKDYIDLDDIHANEIAERLTNSGLEVEDVECQGKQFENFVVGLVKEKKKHPNADKLSVCLVSTGDEEYNVVCGAPNIEAGQKIVFAKIGAVVPDGQFKIEKTKIRGEVSFGMICSAKELGLNDDHSGILVLDSDLKIGSPLAEALGLNDVIFEIGVTPNRPDALNHIGVARDLAAIFNRQLKIPTIEIKESLEKTEDAASIEILNTIDCPRYTAKVVKNITIKESPTWLKKKLTNIGLRPINNVVDVTNFVLHEIGQPLHAFDLDKLSGKKIVVKNALEGEVFISLDSKERKLKSNNLMICDAVRSIAIAGVMGGENSEVTIETKNVLIESAYFNPSSIRKTSKSLQLSTDASYRFERGTDPNITLYAANRAAQLISELGGGEILSGALDVYSEEISKKEIELRFSRITKVLGFSISKEDVKQNLNNLGLTIVQETEDAIKVVVPTFRPDIEREIDLIEEVARIYGYDKIPVVERIAVTLDQKEDVSDYKDILRNSAISLGFNEIITNSLQPIEVASIVGNPVEVLNPDSMDMANLRTSLLQGGLISIAKNINVGESNLKVFEIGNIFIKISSAEIKSFNDFAELEKISFIITGKETETTWFQKERDVDLFDLKGIVNSFLNKICLDNVLEDSYYLDENLVFEYNFTKSYKNKVIGSGGSIKKELLKKFDIEQEVYWFEFDINLLKNIPAKQKSFVELLKYPKVFRDCAFILGKQISCKEVIDAIYKGSSKLLKNVKLFDIFESESFGIDKKSMAFSLEYFDELRTLKDEEVENQFSKMTEFVQKEFNAEFRGI